jgi:hypothetical protein
MNQERGSIRLSVAVGILGLAVVGQTVYAAHLGDEIEAVSERCDAADASPAVRPTKRETSSTPTPVASPPPLRLGSADAVEPELASDTTRAAIRGLIAEELELRTVEKREKKTDRNADLYVELRDALEDHGGLAPRDAAQLEQILTQARETRDELRRAEKESELGSKEVTAAMSELRTTTHAELEQLLGDGWLSKVDTAREQMREARRAQRKERGGGGPFWFMPEDG